MIDLHCHLLPGIDDGSKSVEMSLEMARVALADGIRVMACTPHILPSVYDNKGPAIRDAVERLRQALAQADLPLQLVTGADIHVAPNLALQLQQGQALTLNDTRYLLLEPPHHVVPPRLDDHVFGLHAAGYVAILTHPERLTWIEGHYALMRRLSASGALMQITAGSLTGRFGRRPRYWAERMLDEGHCHLLATDAHNLSGRPPRLAEAWETAARRVGEEEATHLVLTTPRGILENVSPVELPRPQRAERPAEEDSGWMSRLSRAWRSRGAERS